MHSPVAPDELVAAIKAEVTAGAAWVKISGPCRGARVAVHGNLPDSGLAAIGADSIEHGKALSHSEIEALGDRILAC